MKHFGFDDTLPDNFILCKKKTTVKVVRVDEDFTCTNHRGHNLAGRAGDYIAEDLKGFYPISKEFFNENYEELKNESPCGV